MPAPAAPDREPSLAEAADRTALDLFEGRVAAGRDRPMLHAAGASLTAGDVDALSDTVARALQERGVRPGDRVGLLMQNDPQFPVVQLGVWKAGAITVPHNPMLRSNELSRQMADAGCRALVCLDSLAAEAIPAAEAAGVGTIAVTGADELLGGRAPDAVAGTEPFAEWLSASGAPAPTAPGPDDLAIITYTSGTTGRPKGACSSHRNLVWAAHVFRDWVGLDAETVVLAAAPLFHVTGQVGHLALGDLLGAPLVLCHRFDADRVLDAADRHAATFLVAAVTAYHALMRARDRAPASLTRLVSGAQTMTPALVAAVERWSGLYLQNIYGMTETTSPAVAVPPGVRAPVDPRTGALAVGIPVTETQALVVDPRSGQALPPGEAGELVVSGPQVVRGYWARPDADAEGFRDGWLRTGDLAVADELGWLYVIDRIKDLINASGFKVAPGEVEEVLRAHPGVQEAAVVGEPDPYRGETVSAYVVPEPGVTLDAEDLEQHCRTRLAAYKCPRAFTVVADLPRTASGKVQRRRLREAT
jgi:long-chain acyl-CoA synthetase